jgi:hypothetical protein
MVGRKGGCHVEFGMAYSMGLELIIVGPRLNAFHYLPDITVLANESELIEHLAVSFPH